MPQKQPTWYYALFGIVLLGVIAAGTWLYVQKGARPTDINDAISQLLATGGTSIQGDGFTVTTEPVAGEPPSLTRTIPATPDLSAEARSLLVAKIDASVAALKKNPASFPDWLELGVERQAAGDYVGAKEAFAYAGELSPDSATPFGNLGYLYFAYLHDYKLAEENYTKARTNDSKNPVWYRSLIDVYLVAKPTEAEPILKQAVAAFPTSLDFQVLLARWYRDQGKSVQARVAYDAAISTAQKSGNTSATQQLTAEKAQVK